VSQRRNYLPQKGAQGRFVLTLLLVIFLVAVITFCNLWVIGNFVVNNYSELGSQHNVWGFLDKAADLIWWRVMLIILVNIIIVAIIGIFYSHQFAGPSYKFEKSLREIAQGDLSFKIILRQNDSMHNVADSLNRMIDNYRAVIAKAKELTFQSRESLGHLKPQDEETEKAVMAMKSIQGELEDLLAGFKLSSQDEPGDSSDES
jgi:methyl-accepting chemotaxis protein